jgi:lipoprotein-releasing system permease protein
MPFETFVARRFLKIRHQRKLVPLITILAVLGVAVGVMVLIVVIAVMTGFQSELRKRILGIESDILVMRYDGWIGDYAQVVEKIDRVQGVISSAPYVYAQGMLRSPKHFSAVVLKGIDPERSQIQVGMKGDRTLKQLLSENGGGASEAGIVLGNVLAQKLKVGIGDNLLLTVISSYQKNPRILPTLHHLKVIGLFETGMNQYDEAIGFMNMHRLQRIIGVGDHATGIEVRVRDEDKVEAVTSDIVASLGIQYWATQWKQMHRNLFSMLALQKLMMYVILTLIIIVAAFNIASALIMMVKEKVKDIAILKVMGASNRSIQRIFFNKGLVIGLTGIALGCGAGLVLCWILSKYPFIDLPGDVYFLTTLPVKITLLDLSLIILGTLFICGFASLYPAVNAARINPSEGVRYG